MIADQRACFPKCQRCWRYDCRLFGESGEAEHECSWHCISGACGTAAIEVERESPEREGRGKDVGVSSKQLNVIANPATTLIQITNYDNTYPGANGAQLEATVVYEA